MPSREMIKDQAASKIIWGEREETVLDFLASKGFGFEDAEKIVRKAVRERDRAMRSNGPVKLILGLILFVVCTVLSIFALIAPSVKSKLLLFPLVPGVIYGFAKVREGFSRITKGAKEPGQVIK